MGLIMEFLVGNDEKIIDAVKEFDTSKLHNNVIQCADLSLHLSPDDLDTLSISASKFNKQEAILLSEYLEVLVDQEDCGLFLINNEWISYFSSLKKSDLEELTKEWLCEMQNDYPYEEITVNEDSINAVIQVWGLCNFALNHDNNIFFLWTL
ncbi:hypothetical protein [Neobacillus sp. Marseille-QA0830]